MLGEERQSDRLAAVSRRAQGSNRGEEGIFVLVSDCVIKREGMLGGEAGEEVSDVILEQQFLVRLDVRHVGELEGADDGDDTRSGISKCFSNSVRATRVFAAEGKLP